MTQEEIKYHNRLWYYKTYNQLIDKCIQMEKEGYTEDMYTEVHHILPKCMGGTNEKCNLVRMPIRYHIIAHMLLASAFPDEKKIVIAVTAILSPGKGNQQINRKNQFSKISTRLISKFREEANKARIGFKHSEKSKKVMSEKAKINNLGRKVSEETKKVMSESHIQYNMTLTNEEKKSKYASKGYLNKKHSKETKEKLSELNSKKVIGPDGTIYKSMKSASESIGISINAFRWRLKKHKDFGYRLL